MLYQLMQAPKMLRDWLFRDNSVIEDNTESSLSPKRYFLACIAIYSLYLIIRQPSVSLGGEMWAEMATNYYVNAGSPSLFVNFFSTDAGYIPLPQRIIAYIGTVLSIPDVYIPYYYTWSAILITACMVSTFCLTPFRALVRSDGLRFACSIAILMVCDFETRTFINFTYFAAFFVAIVTALAMVKKEEQVPWWAWVIPVLMVSKPAVLSVLPAMILVSLFSKSRFKLIAASAVAACIVQLFNIYLNHSAGPFNPVNHFSLFEKITASAKYFVGFLGAFSTGKFIKLEATYYLWVGAIIFLGCLTVVTKKRTHASALILVGLSVLFSNVLLNAFALSDSWNISMDRLNGVPLYRHIIVGYFAVVLIIVGLVESYIQHAKSNNHRLSRVPSSLLFLLWFVLSGWSMYAWKISKSPTSPVIYNSQWQENAANIKSRESICIPIDPFGWMYTKNCSQINPEMNWAKPLDYRPLQKNDKAFSIDLDLPSSQEYKNLISLAVLVKPGAPKDPIRAELVLAMKDGRIEPIHSTRQLDKRGGLIMFSPHEKIPLTDIERITLKFETQTDVGFVSNDPKNPPAVIWMGN